MKQKTVKTTRSLKNSFCFALHKLLMNVSYMLMIAAESEVPREFAVSKRRTVVALCVREPTVIFLYTISIYHCKLFLNHLIKIVQS